MAQASDATTSRSFLGHARLIGAFTLLSRLLGLAREVVAGHYLGTGLVASAFTIAFTIPNLFRKLLGEGALSQAFIPLYAQAVKRGQTETGDDPRHFAAASVKLLTIILLAITLIGEAIVLACLFVLDDPDRPDRAMMLKFTLIMLPYVTLVCGGALLAAILQVHKRFGAPAFAPVLLNVVHIGVVVAGAWYLGLGGHDPLTPQTLIRQEQLAYLLSAGVIVAGALQVMILMPALRAVGARFSMSIKSWTPDTRKMLRLSLPVAIGAAVLQTSVLLDKAISYTLMEGGSGATGLITHFSLFGYDIRYPMELGATRRLELAQLMYQFPLGIFAIALATAIFPSLAAGAMDADKSAFKRITRQGAQASLWESLPASVGLVLVADPAVRLLFQHGQITAHDASLIAYSTQFYAAGIWSYSLLQVINRAYYALHDTFTPLIASAVNIVVNLIVELPLIWLMGEAGMAVGTLVSFSIQAIFMLWLLDRRVGGLGLKPSITPVLKMLIATAIMCGACLLVQYSPLYPAGDTRWVWLAQLMLITSIGAIVYIVSCRLLRISRSELRH
jgi:putative peptidoglycan lipid II flippase